MATSTCSSANAGGHAECIPSLTAAGRGRVRRRRAIMAALSTQHRASTVSGNTSRNAAHNPTPQSPSPTATTGARPGPTQLRALVPGPCGAIGRAGHRRRPRDLVPLGPAIHSPTARRRPAQPARAVTAGPWTNLVKIRRMSLLVSGGRRVRPGHRRDMSRPRDAGATGRFFD